MEIGKNFWYNLVAFFLPNYWLRNYKTDKDWDTELNRLLDNYDFTDIKQHTAKLGNTIVWVENHPYASYTPRIQWGVDSEFMAKRGTVLRAEMKLGKRRVKAHTQNYQEYKLRNNIH